MTTRAFLAVPRLPRLAWCSTRSKSTSVTDAADIKPFSQIPGNKGLPVIGNLIQTISMAKESHKYAFKSHEEYGPIFRSRAGIIDLVFLADVNAIEQLLRQDGRYPERLQIEIWKDYRKRHGIPNGLVMADGPDWQRIRSALNQPMLKVREVNSYAPDFNAVVTEFIDRIHRIRQSDNSIPSLDEELFKWSIESICRILFEKRLGCLSDTPDLDTQAFTDCIHIVFESARKLVFLPPGLARYIRPKIWRQHEDAWTTTFRIAGQIIDEKIEKLEKALGDEAEVGFLGSLLRDSSLSKADVYSNVTDLMGAAVDTTSNTTQHALNELARNPHVQNILLEEVNRVVPPGEQPSADHLKDMHYLKAVIKETLRLYPTGAVVMRKLTQEAVILGYHLPKGTAIAVHLYVLGRLPQYFENPDQFIPERWLREEGKEKVHPFAWLPFGFGTRMCIGRRVAEMEMQLLVAQIVRKFRVESVTDEPMELKTDLLLLPKKPVQLRLVDR